MRLNLLWNEVYVPSEEASVGNNCVLVPMFSPKSTKSEYLVLFVNILSCILSEETLHQLCVPPTLVLETSEDPGSLKAM